MHDRVLPSLDNDAYPFQPALVNIGGNESLSVVDIGGGHPVVFSHGTPTWSYDWRLLMRQLSPRFRCIAPDHLGFGRSPRPRDADYSPEAHADRFRRLLDRLGLERYSLVVHDFGGPIALDAALDAPERVASLVIFNSFAWPFDDTWKTALQAKLAGSGVFRWLYRRRNFSFVIADSAWGDRTRRDAHTWAMHRSLFQTADDRERVLFALAESLTRSRPFFERLWQRRERLRRTPVHLIWGLKDPAMPPAFLARFREAWPHATVLSLPTAGHWPHEELPDLCLQSLETCLRPLEGPGRKA